VFLAQDSAARYSDVSFPGNLRAWLLTDVYNEDGAYLMQWISHEGSHILYKEMLRGVEGIGRCRGVRLHAAQMVVRSDDGACAAGDKP